MEHIATSAFVFYHENLDNLMHVITVIGSYDVSRKPIQEEAVGRLLLEFLLFSRTSMITDDSLLIG
jgi:hypothetical protein